MTDFQLERFRKVVKTKDGSLVVLRPLVPADGAKLVALFQDLPQNDKALLKHDVSRESLVASWAECVDYSNVFPLVATLDEAIVADATLHRNPGTTMAHVAEVRITIGSAMQGKGLGVVMLEEILAIADKLGLEQVMAQVPVGSTIAQRAFERAGFRQEAVFKDFFKGADNIYHDVAVFFLVLRQRWEDF